MPFAPGLDPAELRTRLRAMRALTHVLTGPRGAELSGLLLSAENDNDALANGEMSIKRLVMTGNRLSLTFANPEMDQEFALEDLEEGLLWGVLLFSVRWHHVKARASVQR